MEVQGPGGEKETEQAQSSAPWTALRMWLLMGKVQGEGGVEA